MYYACTQANLFPIDSWSTASSSQMETSLLKDGVVNVRTSTGKEPTTIFCIQPFSTKTMLRHDLCLLSYRKVTVNEHMPCTTSILTLNDYAVFLAKQNYYNDFCNKIYIVDSSILNMC